MGRGLSDRTLAKLVVRAQTQELREDVARERDQVADVKRARSERLAAITAECRELHARHTTDARRKRVELRAAIEAAQDVIKTKCAHKRGEADEATAERLIAAIAELDEVRERLRIYLAGVKLPPKDPGRVRGGQRAAELQQEMIDSVAYDLGVNNPRLEPVWRNMARRLPVRYRANQRRSAIEGFAEWAGDHPGEVAAIQDKLLGRSIDELEARETEERADEREAYDRREAKRLRAQRKLVKVTAASARKLDADALLDRFEEVTNALAAETDADQVAALRRASDILQNDLVSRGLFEAGAAVDQAAGDEEATF